MLTMDVVSRVSMILLVQLLCYTLSAFGQFDSHDYMKREHSLAKPYQSAGMNVPYWDFLGSTMVTNNYVRLTPDMQSKGGALWNQVPCRSKGWEMHVSFKVHGTEKKDLYGDGMVIWYAKERMIGGPVFGSKDFFSGLAIILDTYSNHNGPHNHQHPYISAMVNNGTLHYDHDMDGTLTQLAGCEGKFRNTDHETIVAIRYEHDILTVSTNFENDGKWKECFQVNGVLLPTNYYFGVSATTGDLSDNHDVVALRFFELEGAVDPRYGVDRSQIVPQALTFEPPRERKEDKPKSMSNLKIFFMILFGMIGAVVLTIVGIMYYQKHKENSRKRFY